MRILVVDNSDSFVYTIVGLLEQLGAQVDVVHNTSSALISDDNYSGYQGVLVSPGPGNASEAGASQHAINESISRGLPVLGICLGHQVIGDLYGARIGAADELKHGKQSVVVHDGSELFAHIPRTFRAGRYHSLAIQVGTVPSTLRISAYSDSGIVMGIADRHLPVYGIQFHPESILTEHGTQLIANWLQIVKNTSEETAKQTRLQG